jgi:5-methylcytosine-specific restriction enzyme A
MNNYSWSKARIAVLERDEYNCVKCGRPATDVHHRQPKKMGGTKNARIVYGLANLVSLCRLCHSWIHGNPNESYDAGWLVRSGKDPEEVGIDLNFGTLMLKMDGTSDLVEACGPSFLSS